MRTTLAAYYVIKRNLPVESIKTIMQTFYGDLGICVNGYILLKTMVLSKKKKDYIKTAVQAGIFQDGFSTSEDRIITITCQQMIKMKNLSVNKIKYYLRLIEYFLSIKIEPSIKDFISLAFVSFNYRLFDSFW